jgi:putative FmdB family regulatory protein
MPLYEYKCHGCGKKFEVIQKFSDEPLKTHPECGGEVERLLSAPALQFKGSGWYVTDYAKNNGPAKSDEKSGSGEKGEKKSGSESSGGETKPAASSEKKSSPASSSPASDKK